MFSTEGVFHIGFMISFNGKPEIYGAVTERRKPSVNSIISWFPSLLCVSVRLLKHSEENDSFIGFVAASSSLYTSTEEDTAINIPQNITALLRQPPKYATCLRIHWEMMIPAQKKKGKAAAAAAKRSTRCILSSMTTD